MINTVEIREVQIQYGKKRKVEEQSFNSPQKVTTFLRKIVPNNSQEHLIALYLDAGHKPCGYSVVCTGLLASCPVHPREVFQRAIAIGAYSVVIAHNHPSGDPTPSKEDYEVTKRMLEAGKVLGIRVLDHIVFTDSNYFSFQSSTDLF